MKADHKAHQNRLGAIQRDGAEQLAMQTALTEAVERLERNQAEIREMLKNIG